MSIYVTGSLYQLYIDVSFAVPTGTSVSAGINCEIITGQTANIKATTGTSISAGINCLVGNTVIEATTGESSSTGKNVYVLTTAAQGCFYADYKSKGRQINMIVVIGRETATGKLVFGYADDSLNDNENIRDPQVDFYRDDSVNTFAYAESVAQNLLDKQRLFMPRGEMTIFPNLAQQQWDVIESVDTVLNPTENFRVKGWVMHYRREERTFVQALKITNV